MNNNVVTLAEQLIACPSITPDDEGCQKIISDYLQNCGFQCEEMPIKNVQNLWAQRGTGNPCVVFLGHTDVVPPGPDNDWTTPPFMPSLRDGMLYGRGAVDMKGAIAAMLVAVQQFVLKHPFFTGTLAFLLTSDEEGPAEHGTKEVLKILQNRQQKIDYCIVGEPSSHQQVGDQIRIGRRGSLHGKLKIKGKQGHVAYPDLALNPIQASLTALSHLTERQWDKNNTDFPATSFQITNVQAGEGITNVIPAELEVLFNFRFSPTVKVTELQKQTEAILHEAGLKFQIEWKTTAQPFMTKKGKLISTAQEVIKKITSHTTRLSTGGGTSDARFIAPLGAEIIELGAVHQTAHQINEAVATQDLVTLSQIYYELLVNLLHA